MFKYLSILFVLGTFTQHAHSVTLDNDGIVEIEKQGQTVRMQKFTLHFTWQDIPQVKQCPYPLWGTTIQGQDEIPRVSCKLNTETALRPSSMAVDLQVNFDHLYAPFTYGDILKEAQFEELSEKYTKLKEEQLTSLNKVRNLIGNPVNEDDEVPAKFILDMKAPGQLSADYVSKEPEFQLGRESLGREFLKTTEHSQFSDRFLQETGYTILPFYPIPSLINAPLPHYVALRIVQD